MIKNCSIYNVVYIGVHCIQPKKDVLVCHSGMIDERLRHIR